jgi:branched-chain amino acid transport system substrate-binding protein
MDKPRQIPVAKILRMGPSRRTLRLATHLALTATAVAVAAGCGATGATSSSGGAKISSSSVVQIAVPAALSGPGAEIGTGAARGIEAAAAAINADGGVLGHQVQVTVKDDAGNASNALALTRSMLTSQQAVAILGSSTSATAQAEAELAREYNVPLLLWGGNDASLTSGTAGSNVFQLEPSTLMEPLASAEYLSRATTGKRYYFIAPDYSFGHDTVAAFKSSMTRLGHPVTDLGEQYVQVGQSSYASYISAAMATRPDVIYLLLFGTDEITFLQEAASYGVFKNTKVYAILGTDLETAMGKNTPAGLYLEDRAPFFLISGTQAASFVNKYRAMYHQWPDEWAFLGYSSLQVWAQAAEKAGSLSGSKVLPALTSTAFRTIRGDFTIRSCDRQAVVPDYFWRTAPVLGTTGWPEATQEFQSDASATLPQCP